MDNVEDLSGQPAEKKPLGFEKRLGVVIAIILVVTAVAIGMKYANGDKQQSEPQATDSAFK